MRLLTDEDLLDRLGREPPLLAGAVLPADCFSRSSPVQSCSVDLSVGKIFLPATQPAERGGENRPLFEHVLGAGETAVIKTRERISLLGSEAAIGFPPTRVSSRGILMTNPGHVDPGYQGAMTVTLVNMGRLGFVVRAGDPVVSLLVFDLGRNVKADYLSRRQGVAKSGSLYLDNLAADFVDVDKRARSIAKSAIRDAELSIKHRQVMSVIWAALGAALLTGVLALITALLNPMHHLEKRLERIEGTLEVKTLEDRIEKLERLTDEK